MSANPSTGSPTLRRSVATRSSSQENNHVFDDKHATTFTNDPIASLKKSALALSSSKLGNQAPKKLKINHETSSASSNEGLNPMDRLLAKLSEQTATLNKQQELLKSSSEDIAYARTLEYVSSATTSVIVPAPATAPHVAEAVSPDEVLRLKLELEAAKEKMARLDQELAQTRTQSIESSDFAYTPAFNGYGRPPFTRDSCWAATQEDTMSDTSEALSAGGYNRQRALWGTQQQQAQVPSIQFQGPNRGRFNAPPAMGYAYSRGSSFDGFTPGGTTPSSTTFGSVGAMGSSSMAGLLSSRPGTGYGGLSGGMYAGYQPSPIGTPLSPTAPEFTAGGWKNEVSLDPDMTKLAAMASLSLTTSQSVATEGQTYLPTTEPLNYRRLLDRTVNCNWKYIVDKIVCNNDQQASIFLQQKLKVGTTEQKYDIVEAIVAQAYPLMVNRFGNFLVQRCFEHGTPEQVIKIAEAIRGNTLNLSMDAFGCHVVQKAFDSVPEDYKAIMVHELLRRIPETVIHRYACHVWQKLFELRWTESPPQIMKYVNDALRGMWHEVALGETGSLVVQNIFENCLEDDKRPCIEEVLASIDIVAHGQFGNWCIQHICEHGAPADRSRAIDHVIRYASEYSMDQFASKVVEKCLKIGGIDFLGRYLDRVCEGRHDRPRIPLIDIASDQYGNYLIQYILTHSNTQHREVVAQHIRKHMVSLRGSKFGSRVGMLCTNPAIQTRPGPSGGPAIAAPTSRVPPTNPRFPNAYR